MAIDVCSEISSTGISPRISFSHDLNNQNREDGADCPSGRLDNSLLDSDFDFCIGSRTFVPLSSADELFSNGKILPIEIKKSKPVSPPPKQTNTEKKQLKEFLSMSIDDDDEEEYDDEDERSCKSFWQFKRSNSLDCDSATSRSKSLIQFLTRSYSTGSAPKQQPKKQPRLQKQHSVPKIKTPAAQFYPYSYYSGQHKLRKCGSYGSKGVTITPVLNISRGTVNLFGLGSFFCNNKVKPKKR